MTKTRATWTTTNYSFCINNHKASSRPYKNSISAVTATKVVITLDPSKVETCIEHSESSTFTAKYSSLSIFSLSHVQSILSFQHTIHTHAHAHHEDVACVNFSIVGSVGGVLSIMLHQRTTSLFLSRHVPNVSDTIYHSKQTLLFQDDINTNDVDNNNTNNSIRNECLDARCS